jgi:hypothetical protein
MTMFDPEKITFFAKTDARGQDIPFGIKAKDRQRHMYVVGKTGMGKSTLLENMAAQDIQNGEGLAFIDPHGSAAEVLLEYVPEHRVKDVVYFAPFDTNHPVSFNVMEDVGADKRHLVVSGLMSTFKKIWVDAWSARMEYILTNALLVLIEYPDTTLLSVNRLFIDKHYRKQVVDYCQDPAVKSFWTEEFAGYTDRFAAEALPAIQNKIGQFTGNPLIRNIIGQPKSSFDIRTIMDERKILIMNLSKGLIGETNANLLGSMLTTRIYLAAMSRADLPLEQMRQMPNFYFYVDEFQSFANATFANILSEARKYHLNLIIAHQYIAQMEEEVRDAVFGNVGTTVSFRVGPFDGEVLETVFAPRFEATDLVNLGFAQIYLTLMIDGIGSQPFSAATLPPVEAPSVSCREMVIEASRKKFAGERSAVEKVVDELHTPKKPDTAATSNSNNNKPNQSGGGAGGFNKNTNGKSGPNPNYKGNNPHNGQTDTARPPQRPAPERASKPPVADKSPDDLRAILSKMTAGNQPKNNSVPEKPNNAEKTNDAAQSHTKTTPEKKAPEQTPPQPNQSGQSNQDRSPAKPQADRAQSSQTDKHKSPQADSDRQSSQSNNSKPQTNQSQNKPQQHSQPRPKQEQRPAAPNNQPKHSAPPKPNNQPNQPNEKPAANDLKSALAAALKQAEQAQKAKASAPAAAPAAQPSQTQPKEPAPPSQTEPKSQPSQPTQPSQPSQSNQSNQSNQIFSARHSGVDVGSAKEPAPAQKPAADSVDPQVIKKMLRHNDQERTPFQ